MSLYEVKPEHSNLFDEFKSQPVGHHSEVLQKILNRFRRGPIEGKYVLICTKQHQEWMLAQLPSQRGGKVTVHHNRIFHSLKEAEIEVFKLRWFEHMGERLDD